MAYEHGSLKDYNLASYWQLCMTMEILPEVLQSLFLTQSLTKGPITIVDYGCSEGHNSIFFFQKLLSSFRETSDREICIMHTDLPDNNWNLVNHLLDTSEHSYRKIPRVYFSSIGKSFYNQILPNDSVHLGFAAHCFHYFSKHPAKQQGNAEFNRETKEEQARIDINTILEHRINELVIGGTLHFIAAGSIGEPFKPTVRVLETVFSAMIERGLLTPEEASNFEMPYHQMDIKFWNTALDKFKDRIEIVRLDIAKKLCPYYLDFIEDGDSEKYREKLSNTIAVLIRLPLFYVLNKSDDEKERTFEVLKELVRNALSESEEIYCEQVFAIIRKIR